MSVDTLTCTFSEDIDKNGVEYPNDGGDFVGCNTTADGRVFRIAIRFTVTSIPSTDTISLVELIVNCDLANNVGSDSWYIGPYNTTGQGDPQADSGATAYSRCQVSGSNYGTFTDFRTTGLKTITLGGSAASDILAASAASSVYTVAIRQVDETTGASQHGSDLKEYVDATDPPKLRITHAPSSVLKDPIGMGVVPAPR